MQSDLALGRSYPWCKYADEMTRVMSGYALYDPSVPAEVKVGDVGCIAYGRFVQFFNVTLPEGDPRNTRGVPRGYEPLEFDNHDILVRYQEAGFIKATTTKDVGINGVLTGPLLTAVAGNTRLAYKSKQDRGATLLTKAETRRLDSLQILFFKDYMIKHHASWLSFVNETRGHGIRLDEIIFVTGCDNTNGDWAVAAYDNRSSEIEFTFSIHGPEDLVGGTLSTWGKWNGLVSEAKNSGPRIGEPHPPQCLFVRGLRMMDRLTSAWRTISTKVPGASGLDPVHKPFISYKESSSSTISRSPSNKSVSPSPSASGYGGGDQASLDLAESWRGNSATSSSSVFVLTPSPVPHISPMDWLLGYILDNSDADKAIVHDNDLAAITSTQEEVVDYKKMILAACPPIKIDCNGVGSIDIDSLPFSVENTNIGNNNRESSGLENLPEEILSAGQGGPESLGNSWWGKDGGKGGRPWHNPPKRQHTIPPDQEIAYERTKLAMVRATSKMIDKSLDVAREALQIGVDTLSLVPIAGLDIAGRVLLNIWLGVQSVETNRLSCLGLTERCANIYYSLREEVNLAGPQVAEALREPVERLTESFRRVEHFIHKQVTRPFFKRYLKRDEDRYKISACDASLNDSFSLFSVAMQVRMLKRTYELAPPAVIEQYPPLLPIPIPIPLSIPTARAPESEQTEMTHIPQGTPEIVAAIPTIRSAQAARDSALDAADLYTTMGNALGSGDDMKMLEVLQVNRSEIQEAIKTLQRALEDRRLVPTRAYGVDADAQVAGDALGQHEHVQGLGLVQSAKTVEAAPSAWTAGTPPPTTVSSAQTQTYSQYSGPPTPMMPGGWGAAPATWDPDQEAAFHREFLEGGLDALRRLSGAKRGDESLPPWTITRWEIDRENKIGIGFFSDVYKGTWRGRPVAIKIVSQNTPRNLFRREVSIWARIKHPHVLELLGASSATGDPPWFFVSPYMKNGNLPTFLKAQVTDNVRGRKEAYHPGPLQMMQEIAIGMAYLHRKNILHGDLKANNVLIDDQLRCVISDFGQSELRSEVYRLSQPKPPRGTLRWQAPELISGESRMTPEADVYAFAIVCTEILTNGEVPWQHLDDAAVQQLVLGSNQRPKIPPQSEVSFGLVSLIEQCWSTSPFSRPIFLDVAKDLGQLINGLRGRDIEASPQPRVGQVIREQEKRVLMSPDMAPLGLPDDDLVQDAAVGYVHVESPISTSIVHRQRVVTFHDPTRMGSQDSNGTSTQSSSSRDERRYRLLLQHHHHPTLNLPLWQPCPVRIGAVGYLNRPHGNFISLFNAFIPAIAADRRVHGMKSILNYGTVREESVSRVERKNFAQIGVEYVRGLLDFTSRNLGGDFQRAVKKRYTYPLRAGHKHAYLCTENTTYRYMDNIDAAKAWFKENIREVLEYYGRQHDLHREDVFLIIGTLETREYGLFVSHEHLDGQVHFNVYSDRREGQDWGNFSTDLELSPSARAGSEYGSDSLGPSSVHATKISTLRTWSNVDVDAVLLAKLRFPPDEEEPTRM